MMRPYQKGDELQIVPLLILAFEKWPFFDIGCSAIDHWRWRYLDNPWKSLLLEILFEDKIIASAHNSLYSLIINGKSYSGSYGTDACVHPSFQGRGLYSKMVSPMTQMKKDTGIRFHYFVTSNPIVIHSKSQRISTPHLFPYKFKYLSRISDINLHIQKKGLKQDYRWKVRHLIERVRSSSLKPRESDLEVLGVKLFDHTFEGFLEKVNFGHDFIKQRTCEYLNWRYIDPRAGNYQVRVVKDKDEIVGYSVLRINKLEDYHTGYFVDLMALPDRVDVAEALLLDGLGFFRDNSVNLVEFQVIENHPYERLFNRYGFFGGEADRFFFYGFYGGDITSFEDISPERFHFPFGALTGI